ncbi:MAG: winged helix DNA-binding protein [Sphingomonadaceae bacterium]
MNGEDTYLLTQSIRQLAENLTEKVDQLEASLDQNQATKGSSRFDLERHLPELKRMAELERKARLERYSYLPNAILGEPAWDIMVDLFIQYCDRRRISVSSALVASNVPSTTALRYIEHLVHEGLVARTPSEHDKRVTFVELTSEGFEAMARAMWSYSPSLCHAATLKKNSDAMFFNKTE